MGWLGRVLKYTILGLYALCGLALVVFTVPATGLKAKSVATGSMRPAIPPGSLVFIQRQPLSRLAVGDVVTYRSPANARQTITHHLVGITQRDRIWFFTTKGDANPATDAPVPGGAILGRVIWHVPWLGRAVDAIKTPLGLVVLVLIPGLVMIVAESRRLHQGLNRLQTSAPPPSPAPRPAVASRPAARPRAVPPQASTAAMGADSPTARPRSGLDGMSRRRSKLLGLATALTMLALGIGTTRAVLVTGVAQLANSQLNIQAPAPSSCLNGGWRQLGFPSEATCLTATSHSRDTHITITNVNQQNANSGNVTITNQTTDNSSSSGSATNAQTTTATVRIAAP